MSPLSKDGTAQCQDSPSQPVIYSIGENENLSKYQLTHSQVTLLQRPNSFSAIKNTEMCCVKGEEEENGDSEQLGEAG